MFEFHAGYVHVDDLVRRLSFADRNDDAGEHYFIMDRSEDSREEVVADMANVYIERDDQCWGGYGGIQSVTLDRDCLTLKLTPRMATRMGDHGTIRVTFVLKDAEFRQVRHNLGCIMYGYEPQLKVREERSALGDGAVEFSLFAMPSASGDR
jgi:hypothetical protein